MSEKNLSNTQKKSPAMKLKPIDILNPDLDHSYFGSIATTSSIAYTSMRPNPSAMLDGRYSGPMYRRCPSRTRSAYTTSTEYVLPITIEDWWQPLVYDKLDLHRIAEKFYKRKLKPEDVQILESLQRAAANDNWLQKALAEMNDPTINLRQATRLDNLPHLLNPSMRKEPNKQYVATWLKTHTAHPEPELVGFAVADLLEPRRFISQEKPRLSHSDSNVLLGKRKRFEEGDDVARIHNSSSDTLLELKGDTLRPLKRAKRQISLEEGKKPL